MRRMGKFSFLLAVFRLKRGEKVGSRPLSRRTPSFVFFPALLSKERIFSRARSPAKARAFRFFLSPPPARPARALSPSLPPLCGGYPRLSVAHTARNVRQAKFSSLLKYGEVECIIFIEFYFSSYQEDILMTNI